MNDKERKIIQTRKMILHFVKNYADNGKIMTESNLANLMKVDIEDHLKYLIENGYIISENDENSNETYIYVQPWVII